MAMKRAGIAVDAWKVPIFERHLSTAGYTYSIVAGELFATITVDGVVIESLAKVIVAANAEAARTRRTTS